MPRCGNCGKPVGSSDVTCAHCGVLLAAYASPEGSGAAGTYEEPPAPPVTEIPSVDMEVKPPSEKDVVTDPTKVMEEPISTAPRPLFDTYLTVEEIARAAEGDHANDVVTVAEGKIASKKVEFDVPDYAKPPVNADPIPTIDEDDDSIPLITHEPAPQRSAPAEQQDDEEDEPDPEPDAASESWLYSRPQAAAAPRPKPARVAAPTPEAEPEPTPTPTPKIQSGPVGKTDDYLRELHAETGYTPTSNAVSRPVEERRPTPAERRRNRTKAFSVSPDQQVTAEDKSMNMGCSTLYVLVLVILWISTVVSVMGGNISPVLIFITMVATWGFGPVRKFVREFQQA